MHCNFSPEGAEKVLVLPNMTGNMVYRLSMAGLQVWLTRGLEQLVVQKHLKKS